MVLTEVTRANAMCWPPFPVIREASIQSRSIHTRLTGTTGSSSRIYHQVGSSLSSSSSSFTARIRWPKLPIFFKYRLPTETENGTVAPSRLQRFDFGCLNSRPWETSTRWIVSSLYVKHGKRQQLWYNRFLVTVS